MIIQKLRKVGNNYVVTIPTEEIERQQLAEGQLLIIEVHPVEVRPVMSASVREAFERSWSKHEDAYQYLADR